MKSHLELIHQIEVLHSWAIGPKDSISALSEQNAKEALKRIKSLWEVLDRRKKA